MSHHRCIFFFHFHKKMLHHLHIMCAYMLAIIIMFKNNLLFPSFAEHYHKIFRTCAPFQNIGLNLCRVSFVKEAKKTSRSGTCSKRLLWKKRKPDATCFTGAYLASKIFRSSSFFFFCYRRRLCTVTYVTCKCTLQYIFNLVYKSPNAHIPEVYSTTGKNRKMCVKW